MRIEVCTCRISLFLFLRILALEDQNWDWVGFLFNANVVLCSFFLACFLLRFLRAFKYSWVC